jgi:uncharacterized repeat protein (TIGR01451 family)
MKRPRFLWPICLFLALNLSLFLLLDNAQGQFSSTGLVMIGSGQRYTEHVPVIDIGDYGYRPVQLPASEAPTRMEQQPDFQQGGGSDPQNPYAIIRQAGPAFASPGAVARFEITLANFESLTHTYQLVDTLPAGLRYVLGSATSTDSVQASGLTYEPKTRTLSWQGALAPGDMDYLIEESPAAIPYLDLADFGAINLCDDFVVSGEDCDEVTVTFNLGVNGYTANLYGQVLSQLTLSSNGLLLGDGATIPNVHGHNQWLPDTTAPGFLLAGLWRDTNMGGMGGADTAHGRWHAAIIRGLVEGHDVFYGQWHDAPHADDSNLTARHAIAVVLDNGGGLTDQPLVGHAFFIYDNISDPAQTVAQGYSIGIEDKLGLRGTTHAYAPCCGDPHPPQGYPPVAGTTLHLRPALFGGNNNFRHTFSFEAMVDGKVPETIINTAYASSNSLDPALADVWATHYLHVRLQTYLPFLRANEVTP